MKNWRPNQSGTFSNRVNIHDKEDRKLFVIEFYTDYVDERQKILGIVENAPELLEGLILARSVLIAKKDMGELSQRGTEILTQINQTINKSIS